MKHILEELEKRRAEARMGGGEKRIANQHAKGKLTARERIDLLLDEGSFTELDEFARHRSTSFGLDRELDWLGQLEGQGRIESQLNRFFFTSGDSRDPELAGIWGRDPAKTEAFAARFGIQGHDDLDRLRCARRTSGAARRS